MQFMFVSRRPLAGASRGRLTPGLILRASGEMVRRPLAGASRGRLAPGLILPLIMILALAACSKQEKPLDPDRDTASDEMLTEADRVKLAQIAAYSPEAIVRVKELLASPDVFVRLMTLTRLERWPRDRALSFLLGATGFDASSLVRSKALALAWRGITQLDHEQERFPELVDATMARLSDADDGVFELAVKQLLTIEDTGHLAKLAQLIPQSPSSRHPRLFQLFCKKDLSRDDGEFIVKHDRQLGTAGPACREQVSRAQRQKYLYECQTSIAPSRSTSTSIRSAFRRPTPAWSWTC